MNTFRPLLYFHELDILLTTDQQFTMYDGTNLHLHGVCLLFYISTVGKDAVFQPSSLIRHTNFCFAAGIPPILFIYSDGAPFNLYIRENAKSNKQSHTNIEWKNIICSN